MKRLSEQKAKTEQKVKICAHSESFVGADAQDADQAAKGVENGMKMPGPLANRGLRRLSKSTNKSLEVAHPSLQKIRLSRCYTCSCI